MSEKTPSVPRPEGQDRFEPASSGPKSVGPTIHPVLLFAKELGRLLGQYLALKHREACRSKLFEAGENKKAKVPCNQERDPRK
jgi:hypothetical protein